MVLLMVFHNNSILTWGTFTAPLKIKYVRDVNFDPMIYQFYFSAVVFLLSFLVLAWNEWYFSWYGVAGAAIWIPSSIFSIVAVDKLGLSVAQGLWSGVVILTNFIWGVTLFESKIGNYYLTALGLVLMILGIVGVATCSKWNVITTTTNKENSTTKEDDLEKKGLIEDESLASVTVTQHHSQETTPLFGKNQSYDPAMNNDNTTPNYGGVMSHLDHLIAQEEASLHDHAQQESLIHRGDAYGAYPSSSLNATKEEYMNNDDMNRHNKRKQRILALLKNSKDYFIGILAAVACGITGGSMFVPSRLDSDRGSVYMVGFGIGSMGITSIMLVVYYYYYFFRYKKELSFYPKLSIFPCLTAMLWQTGNFFAAFVSAGPLGLTIGMPLTETSLVVAGLCGLIFFRELKGWKAIVQFFVSTLIMLVPGCILLALFGKT